MGDDNVTFMVRVSFLGNIMTSRYNWVRDGALVMNAVLGEYEATDPRFISRNNWFEPMLWDYIEFNLRIQTVSTRSASSSDPVGIGEPKYNVDASAFNGEWGRPQNDGPALRASAGLRFAKAFIKKGGDKNRIESKIYSSPLPSKTVVKRDLEMVSHNLGIPSFDLWEEVRGQHFYTLMVQRRALIDGYQFASSVGDAGASDWYRAQSKLLDAKIHAHWNPNLKQIQETLGRTEGIDYKKSNLDVATVLASLHSRGEEDGFYSVSSSRILATALRVILAHQKAFEVNSKIRPDLPPAIGRYTEDTFMGGNPWFLATLALAELHYRLVSDHLSRGIVEVNSEALPFYQWILPSVEAGRYDASHKLYAPLIRAIFKRGDGFLERVRVHAAGDGSMDEQLDRHNGVMKSAKDLTWSYAAFITAARARWQAQSYPVIKGAKEMMHSGKNQTSTTKRPKVENNDIIASVLKQMDMLFDWFEF
jgi:glucoamylase